MQDGLIKGTGNSRYLKSITDFLTQYPTYQDFAAALAAGTLPIDLNGINETGWDQLGTALNKGNLLADPVAEKLGLIYNPVTVDLSTVQDGDIISLPENEKLVNFYCKTNYETGLNGTGQVLLIRAIPYGPVVWNEANVNTYAGSTLDLACQSYKSELPEQVKNAIVPTKFYYTPGNGVNTVQTLTRDVFVLSVEEFGVRTTISTTNQNYVNVEGSPLNIPVANLGLGHHTRSPFFYVSTNTDGKKGFVYLNSNGIANPQAASTIVNAMFLPCFSLPATFSYTYFVNNDDVPILTPGKDPTVSDALYKLSQIPMYDILLDVTIGESSEAVALIDTSDIPWDQYDYVKLFYFPPDGNVPVVTLTVNINYDVSNTISSTTTALRSTSGTSNFGVFQLRQNGLIDFQVCRQNNRPVAFCYDGNAMYYCEASSNDYSSVNFIQLNGGLHLPGARFLMIGQKVY